MADQAWKRTERIIAGRLGGRRQPVSGRQRGDAPDITDVPGWSLEVKHRRRFPSWLHDAMAQALAARQPGARPLVILHQHGAPHADNYVVMRQADFEEEVQRR